MKSQSEMFAVLFQICLAIFPNIFQKKILQKLTYSLSVFTKGVPVLFHFVQLIALLFLLLGKPETKFDKIRCLACFLTAVSQPLTCNVSDINMKTRIKL